MQVSQLYPCRCPVGLSPRLKGRKATLHHSTLVRTLSLCFQTRTEYLPMAQHEGGLCGSAWGRRPVVSRSWLKCCSSRQPQTRLPAVSVKEGAVEAAVVSGQVCKAKESWCLFELCLHIVLVQLQTSTWMVPWMVTSEPVQEDSRFSEVLHTHQAVFCLKHTCQLYLVISISCRYLTLRLESGHHFKHPF